ncbi:MAG: ATP-binding protein, partial [Ignavibacteriaceae bacterium]
MDLSKLEEGKMKLEVVEQDIIALIKGIVLSFASLAERKRITFRFNTIEESLNVYIDKDKVEKILINLLSNAFKFTPEGELIELKVGKNEGYVDISVQDSGIGIPEEKMSKIFDRFYQVNSGHKREHEGTGIGLALSKELIEIHRGKIEVESEEGKGTTITISIPLDKKHYTAEEIHKSVDVKKSVPDLIPELKLIEETENEKIGVNVNIGTEKPI